MWVTAHMSILEILLYAYKRIYIHMFFIYPGSGERWNNQQSDGPSSEPPKAMEEPTGPESWLSGPGASSGVF